MSQPEQLRQTGSSWNAGNKDKNTHQHCNRCKDTHTHTHREDAGKQTEDKMLPASASRVDKVETLQHSPETHRYSFISALPPVTTQKWDTIHPPTHHTTGRIALPLPLCLVSFRLRAATDYDAHQPEMHRCLCARVRVHQRSLRLTFIN